MFLDKVIYAVDIFNSKNCLPVVGMELLVIKKKVKGKKNSPLVVKSKYLNRIKGNFRTKWKKTSHPIYEWNKDANLIKSVHKRAQSVVADNRSEAALRSWDSQHLISLPIFPH